MTQSKYDFDTLIASVFSLVFFVGRIGDGGLRSDNLLYASISKSVIGSDNPMVLHLGNTIYLNKPPLFFWLNAMVIKLFGSNVFSVKLVSALAAAALTVLVFKMAKEIFNNANAGYAAMFFFCFNYIIFKNSHACRLESTVTLFMVIGFLAADRYIKYRGLGYIILSGIFFGLTVLTKGYIGAIGFICMLAYLTMCKEKPSFPQLSLAVILTSLAFFLTFSWWFAYMIKHTDFINTFFYKESLARIVDTDIVVMKHDPVYKYLVKFVTASILMLPFLILGLKNIRQILEKSPFMSMASLFSVVYLIIIHLLSTKYDRYLFPILYVPAIIAAYGFIELFNVNMRSFFKVITVAFCLVLVILPPFKTKADYSEFPALQTTAKANGGDLCVSKAFALKWEHSAALSFYTDGYKVEQCSKNDIRINQNDAFCPGYTLVKNSKFSACYYTEKF